MQEFIPDAETFCEFQENSEDDYAKVIEKYRPDLIKMWIFDIIIGNTDRHGGNFLIQGDTLYAIDHGYSLKHTGTAFLTRLSLYSGYKEFFDEEIPGELIEGVKSFLERPEEQEILEDLLSELLDREYASACLKRIKIIGDMLIKDGRLNETPSNSMSNFIEIL